MHLSILHVYKLYMTINSFVIQRVIPYNNLKQYNIIVNVKQIIMLMSRTAIV